MDKIIKILDKLNDLLYVVFSKIGNALGKLVPQGLKNGVTASQKSIQNKKNKLKTKAVNLKDKSLTYTKQIDIGKIKEDVKTQTDKIKAKTKGADRKKMLALLGVVLVFIWTKIKAPFVLLSPNVIATSLIVGAFGIIGAIQTYKSSSHIVKEITEEPIREIAAVDRKRGDYYKNETRQILLSDLRVPVYIKPKDPKSMKGLRIEFKFEMTTRYSRKFIQDHEHEIRDYIISQVEPMEPEFILQNEGKEIIKAKIKKELNVLLKNRGYKGQVGIVSIDSIIGG